MTSLLRGLSLTIRRPLTAMRIYSLSILTGMPDSLKGHFMTFIDWLAEGIKYVFVGCALIWTGGMACLMALGVLGLILTIVHVI